VWESKIFGHTETVCVGGGRGGRGERGGGTRVQEGARERESEREGDRGVRVSKRERERACTPEDLVDV